MLLFDEADAVFGKRSEVKDAHDRYANMESAYLLQRLESFDGIALLTTNLRANIDEAFTRRLDLVVDFPFPDAEQRLALWRHSLAHVPCAADIDPEPRGPWTSSWRAAPSAAPWSPPRTSPPGAATPVTTADLLEGARREYRKAGRLVPGEGDLVGGRPRCHCRSCARSLDRGRYGELDHFKRLVVVDRAAEVPRLR